MGSIVFSSYCDAPFIDFKFRMGYSQFLNSTVLLCEKDVKAKRYKKERPSIEKENFQASVLGDG